MLGIRNFSDDESSNKTGLVLGAGGTGAAMYIGNKKFKESAKKEYKKHLQHIAEKEKASINTAREKWRAETAKNDMEQLLNDRLRKKGFIGRMWDKIRGRESEYDLHNKRINKQRELNNLEFKEAIKRSKESSRNAARLAKKSVKSMKALKLGSIGMAGLSATMAAHMALNKNKFKDEDRLYSESIGKRFKKGFQQLKEENERHKALSQAVEETRNEIVDQVKKDAKKAAKDYIKKNKGKVIGGVGIGLGAGIGLHAYKEAALKRRMKELSNKKD